MKASRLAARDVVLSGPKITGDSGFNFISLDGARFSEAFGKEVQLVRDNLRALKFVLNGLWPFHDVPKGPPELMFREVEVCA
jgi:hypothetical protein